MGREFLEERRRSAEKRSVTVTLLQVSPLWDQSPVSLTLSRKSAHIAKKLLNTGRS